MVFIFYRPKNQYIKEEGKTRMQELKDLDWIGFALWAIGLCLFLLGISFGGDLLTWWDTFHIYTDGKNPLTCLQEEWRNHRHDSPWYSLRNRDGLL
jgi:hypothetical protein